VEATFCINPPKASLILSGDTADFILRSSNDSGNQWYLNDQAIQDATGNSFSITEEDTYTVMTSIDEFA
jgi:hypothetical protein